MKQYSFEHKTSKIICGDNLTISGTLEDESFDMISFDPPFSTLYPYNNYTDFLNKRIDVCIPKLKDNGTFVSVNYSDGTEIVEKTIENYGYACEWNSSIQCNNRGNYRRFNTIEIRAYSKKKTNNNTEIIFGDIMHKPGNNGVCEAMRTWEVEGILYASGILKNKNVLDMFGGGGTFPYVCNMYGNNCTSIENDFSRYIGILGHLQKPRQVKCLNIGHYNRPCSLITCNCYANVYNKVEQKYFCKNHYNILNCYKRNNRNAFLGLDITFKPITIGEKMHKFLKYVNNFLYNTESTVCNFHLDKSCSPQVEDLL